MIQCWVAHRRGDQDKKYGHVIVDRIVVVQRYEIDLLFQRDTWAYIYNNEPSWFPINLVVCIGTSELIPMERLASWSVPASYHNKNISFRAPSKRAVKDSTVSQRFLTNSASLTLLLVSLAEYLKAKAAVAGNNYGEKETSQVTGAVRWKIGQATATHSW